MIPAGDDLAGAAAQPCCPRFHEAVELVGRRWTGAIIETLRRSPRPLRFGEIAAAVPGLSDRMCAERVKELETRGLVVREVRPGPRVRVTYALTDMGHALGPALSELGAWAVDWLDAPGPPVDRPGTGRRPGLR